MLSVLLSDVLPIQKPPGVVRVQTLNLKPKSNIRKVTTLNPKTNKNPLCRTSSANSTDLAMVSVLSCSGESGEGLEGVKASRPHNKDPEYKNSSSSEA